MKPDYKIKSLREVIKIVAKEPQITTIIFDLGDTLFTVANPDELEFKRDQEQFRLIKRKYPKINISFDRYLNNERIFLEKIEREKSKTFKEVRFEVFAELLLKSLIGKSDLALLKQFCDIQYKYSLRKIKMRPHTKSILEKLQKKGCKLGIITNTWHGKEQIYKKLNKIKIRDFFSSIIISADFGAFKPNPAIFKKSLKELKSKPNEAIFVGNDMEADIYGAKNVGIKTILIRE